MDLEPRHLKVVCAIAEHGSVTRAAAHLGLARPALTAQLNRIGRALGGPLFDRDHRGTRPTPLGELVLSRAKVVLPAVADLRQEAARLASTPVATIRYRIGSVGNSMVGGLLRRLSESRPDTGVTTQASWSALELTELVAAGRLGFAIVGVCGDAPPPPGLEWRLVAVDAVGVLLAEDHPLAGADEVDLAEFATARWAATPGDGCFADCFAAACARAGFAAAVAPPREPAPGRAGGRGGRAGARVRAGGVPGLAAPQPGLRRMVARHRSSVHKTRVMAQLVCPGRP